MEHNISKTLDIEALKEYASRWAGDFPQIRKIGLYPSADKWGAFRKKDIDGIDVKYVIGFETFDENGFEQIEQVCMDAFQASLGKKPFVPVLGIGEEFTNVYQKHHRPSGYFLAEFHFFAKRPSDVLFPLVRKEEEIVLWSRAARGLKGPEEPGAQTPQLEANEGLPYPAEVLSLIRTACPEIERLWNSLQSIKKTIPKQDRVYDLYREAAFRFYEDNHGSFQIIEKVDLNEYSSVFSPNSESPDERHLRRDIIGKLYQAIINRTFPQELPEPGGKQDYSVKKLYDLHKAELKRIAPTSPQLRPNPT